MAINNDNDNLAPLFIPRDIGSVGKTFDVVPFSKQTFNDVDVASRYLTSEPFREFWSRGQVPVNQEYSFGYRVNTGQNRWLGDNKPFERRDYRALFAAEDNKIKTGVSNTQTRAEKEFDDFWKAKNAGKNPHTTDDLLLQGDRSKFIDAEIKDYLTTKQNRGIAVRNAARVEGRFFTPLTTILEAHNAAIAHPPGSEFTNFKPIPQDPLAYYLNASAGANWRGTAGQYGRPINMLISENLPNYSLHKFNPFGLDYEVAPFDEFDFFNDVTSGKNANELKPKYGKKLGAAVSTNPKQEAFVPRTMANTARQVGRVVDLPTDQAEIQIWGPPSVSPKRQLINNIARNTPKVAMGGLLIADAIQNGPVHAVVSAVAGPVLDLNAGENEYLATRGVTRFEPGDPTAKKLEEDRSSYLKQQAEEKRLRKEASDVMLKTKTVEENISKSPFWTTFK